MSRRGKFSSQDLACLNLPWLPDNCRWEAEVVAYQMLALKIMKKAWWGWGEIYGVAVIPATSAEIKNTARLAVKFLGIEPPASMTAA